MGDNGDIRDDLKVPDGELGQKIRVEYEGGNDILVSAITMKIFLFVVIDCLFLVALEMIFLVINCFCLQCTVLKSCGEECVIAYKNNTTGDKS